MRGLSLRSLRLPFLTAIQHSCIMTDQMTLNEKQATYDEAKHNEHRLATDMHASSDDLEKSASDEATGDLSRVGDNDRDVVTAKTWAVVAVSDLSYTYFHVLQVS